MIFAIYKWLSEKPDKGVGQFTNGQLYIAEANLDGVLDIHNLILSDDNDEKVTIHPFNERFEYPEEVFGVIVKPLGALMPGEVVIIDDADDEGAVLSIKDMGFVKSENIQLLDLASIFPEMMVYDKADLRWKKIKRIDDCMRIQVDDEMRDCTEFVFAISEEELAIVPLARCVDEESSSDNLTKGSLYQIKGLNENGMLIVDDDTGKESVFASERFEFV